MIGSRFATSAIAFAALTYCGTTAGAAMGPCTPAVFDLMCGNGDGAARVVVKTISPSKRLGFAWRLADRPPSKPNANDPKLENLVVRVADGAVLARSHGAYWDLGAKIAKAYLMSAWSPDSRLFVKVEQRAASACAELFAFADNDAAVGPFDLASVIMPAIEAKMGANEMNHATLLFMVHPAMTMSDRGTLHATVAMRQGKYGPDGPVYDVTVQVTPATRLLDAKVVSVVPHVGASISVTVY